MKLDFARYKIKSRIYIPLMLLVFLGLLASRRWQQIVSPQVWDEDGVCILNDFIKSGWKAFFIPVENYLNTSAKLISAISLGISFAYYPMVSTIISWLFIAFVGLAIALAPTKLKGRFFCAVSVFAIPSNPEVFGLPLYTFWWASLLLFLCALWDEKRPLPGWRLSFLILGGLSSPVIILILPVLYLRVFLYRSFRAEKIIAFVATLIAAVQAFFIFENHGLVSKPKLVLLDIIPKFFSSFLSGNLHHNIYWFWAAGVGLLGLIVFWLFQNRNVIQTWILFYLLMGSIGQTAARVDLSIIHPVFAGPRYFFFPFVLIFWVLIEYFYSAKSKWLQGFIGIILIVGTLNAIPAWSRTHDDLHWTNHVFSSRFFTDYNLPIMVDGNRSAIWSLTLPGKTCESLLEHDTLVSKNEMNKHPAYPDKILNFDGRDEKLDAKLSSLINTTMIGGDSSKSKIKGYRIIGSYKTSDSDTGEISLKLRRGDHLLYRSGPTDGGGSMSIADHEQEFIQELPYANNWVTLDFSNQKLPSEFILMIMKDGEKRDQWCAIALKK